MSDKNQEVQIIATISEITSDASHVVKLDEELVRRVTEGDSDPKFPIVWVDEGKSGNGIIYDAEILKQVAEQVNSLQPVGYLGHQHREGKDLENLLPDPQTIWLGAAVVDSPDQVGKKRIYVKGYNLPGSKLRQNDWLKRMAINSVSWTGDAVLTPVREGGYKVKQLMLESIDWSRKNRSGMRSGVLVAEMEGEDEVTAEEIAKLQLAELEAHNPGLVKSIKEQVATEKEAEKTVAVDHAVTEKENELNAAHEQALAENPDITMMQKIRDALEVPEGTSVLDFLTKLIEETDKLQKRLVSKWFHEEVLDKKIPNEKARGIIARLVPVAEMQGDWRSESGVEKIKEELNSRVDEALEKDEDIKALVAEMGSSRGGPRFTRQEGGTSLPPPESNNGNSDYSNSPNLEPHKVAV